MIQAILLDLDNTLLKNDMEHFVPAYLTALSEHMADLFSPQVFIQHLLSATDMMTVNTDASKTNMQVFDEAFFSALGRSRQELEPLFEQFYATQFSRLRSVTQPIPAARPLVEWAFDQGFQVVVATNPLFPQTAIEQRLEWAEVPVNEFSYHLVTSYEGMHAAKPHHAYYLEIAQRLDRQPEECLMVGDDDVRDILPALEVGMQGYWIAEADQTFPPGGLAPAGQGSLEDCYAWLQDTIHTGN